MNQSDSRPAAPAHRRRRTVVLAVLAVVMVVGAAVGLALFQPWKLFTHSTVNEAAPAAAPVVAAPAPTMAATTASTTASTTDGPPAPTSTAPAEPAVLASGPFVDGEHATAGTAIVLQLPDGARYLRLENFSTSDGPDVDVILSDRPAGGDDWGSYDDGRYLTLGDLKGTDGNQNYQIPADADLTGLTSVVIWCDRFDVAFGTAAVNL